MGVFCELCDIEFKSEKAFKDHFNILHVGNISFMTVGGLQYTFTRSTDGYFRCPTCSTLMKSVDSLYTHVQCIYGIPSYKRALNEYKKHKKRERKQIQIHLEESDPESDCEDETDMTMEAEVDYNAEDLDLEGKSTRILPDSHGPAPQNNHANTYDSNDSSDNSDNESDTKKQKHQQQQSDFHFLNFSEC